MFRDLFGGNKRINEYKKRKKKEKEKGKEKGKKLENRRRKMRSAGTTTSSQLSRKEKSFIIRVIIRQYRATRGSTI